MADDTLKMCSKKNTLLAESFRTLLEKVFGNGCVMVEIHEKLFLPLLFLCGDEEFSLSGAFVAQSKGLVDQEKQSLFPVVIKLSSNFESFRAPVK